MSGGVEDFIEKCFARSKKRIERQWKHLIFLLSILNHGRQFFPRFLKEQIFQQQESNFLWRDFSTLYDQNQKTEYYKQITGKAYRYIDLKKEIYLEILVIKINVLVEVQRISMIVATAKQLIF